MIANFLQRSTLAAAVTILSCAAAQAESLSLRRIDNAIVLSISADGKAAAGQLPGNYESFRWTARSGVVPLGRSTMDVLGHRSGMVGISADGKAVSATILSDDGTYSTAGRWTESSGWKMLANPGPADIGFVDGENCSAWAISADGNTVAGLYWVGNDSWKARAMRWTAAGGMVDMGSSGYNSRINASSADGRVLAGWDEHPEWRNWRATVWVDGVRTTLEDSDWFTEVTAMNRAGTILVGQTPDHANGSQMTATMWKWNGSSWVKSFLGAMPKKPGVAASSRPNGVSDDGSVVVGQNNPEANKPVSVGFIWTPSGGMVKASDWLAANGVTLNPGWPVIAASAVSPDGKVIVLNQQQKLAPWGARSLIVRRQP